MDSPHILFTAALVVAIAPAFGQSIVERAQRDEITHMASEEPAMREAFRKARATLDDFLSSATRPAQGTTGYALKVAISEGRATEYFWVNSFFARDDRFIGILNNEPRMVKKHKLGDRIEFSREQIADWVYIDGAKGRMVGNFTACALLTKEPPAEAEEFRRRYGLQCD
jgi:uncharacterized protein YegJ (DUF2314 family)